MACTRLKCNLVCRFDTFLQLWVTLWPNCLSQKDKILSFLGMRQAWEWSNLTRHLVLHTNDKHDTICMWSVEGLENRRILGRVVFSHNMIIVILIHLDLKLLQLCSNQPQLMLILINLPLLSLASLLLLLSFLAPLTCFPCWLIGFPSFFDFKLETRNECFFFSSLFCSSRLFLCNTF